MTTPEEAIRATMASYVRLVDQKDTEGLVRLFTDDGRLLIRGSENVGAADIRAFLDDLFTTALAGVHTLHIVSNHLIDVRDRQASAISDLLVLRSVSGKPWEILVVNTHEDRLVLIDNVWRFAEKRVATVQP